MKNCNQSYIILILNISKCVSHLGNGIRAQDYLKYLLIYEILNFQLKYDANPFTIHNLSSERLNVTIKFYISTLVADFYKPLILLSSNNSTNQTDARK
jgi:hypothetical protein